jgi:hypothetical protein
MPIRNGSLGGLFGSLLARWRTSPNEMNTLENTQKKFLTAHSVDANVVHII